MQFAWSRPAIKLPPGSVPSLVMVLLLTLVIGNSTVAAAWVPGSAVVVRIALLSALVAAALAMARRIPWQPALLVVIGLAPVMGYLFALPALRALHPGDSVGPGLLSSWAGRIGSGEAGSDASFFTYMLAGLFWLVGGWLSWATLRWRQPLLGLVPGAVAFAANVLNYPTDQNGYTLAFIVLTLALLLWNSYQRSLEGAAIAGMKLSGEARWDFWEKGVVVTAALVILGIFLPPLSTTDSSVDIENGLFRSWAELQQRLNHPVRFGHGPGGGNSIGFSSDVPLGGPIQQTGGVVFVYSIDGQYFGPRYFRGLNLIRTAHEEWSYDGIAALKQTIPKDQVPPYFEEYQARQTASFKISMLKPPRGYQDVIFYPDQLYRVDRPTVAAESLLPTVFKCTPGASGSCLDTVPNREQAIGGGRIQTVDRLSALNSASSAGNYRVVADFSTAHEDQLRGAGTRYPPWLEPYRFYGDPLSGRPSTYRSPEAFQAVHDLAIQVTAGISNPYDKAVAIERYLRANYTYTLTPPLPPAGVDPLQYFLNTSKTGYCQYFASAMGDMLRSLGIPTRLVNGYGPGTYDQKLGKWVVKESDAHSWVEVYFPTYGWIPFEPTPDGTYFPIARGTPSDVVCRRDSCDVEGIGAGGAAPIPVPTNQRGFSADEPNGNRGVGGLTLPSARSWPGILAALLALLAVGFLFVSRYLRPATVAGVWSRAALLARLGGVPSDPGETPSEYGRRLAREVPEAGPLIRQLADNFAVAAYAPPALASRSREGVLSAWQSLRPLLLRRIAARLRPAH